MVPRAMLAVVYASGRSSHAIQVKGDDVDKKGLPWSSRLGIGLEANTPPRKGTLLRNLKEMKLDGYFDKDMEQYTKFASTLQATGR